MTSTTDLSDAERTMLGYALDLAQEQIYSRGDEFSAESQAAVESLRQHAAEPDDTDLSEAAADWTPCSPEWLAAMPEGACSWAPRRSGDGRVVSHYHPAVPSSGRAALLHETADAIDAETRRLKADGVLEPDKFRPCRDASAQLRAMAAEPQQPTDGDVVEAHRLALSFALDLGTGAPWDAIHERAAELRRVAAEEQPAETQAAPALSELEAAARTVELDRDAAASGESRDYRRGMTRAVEVLRLIDAPDAMRPVVGEQPDTQETRVVPPVHYRRDDGVDCCVHTIPVGPDSCRHCRELAE